VTSTGANLDCLVNFAQRIFNDRDFWTLFIKLEFILSECPDLMVNRAYARLRSQETRLGNAAVNAALSGRALVSRQSPAPVRTMGEQRKIFRVEETAATQRERHEPASEDAQAALRHAEILRELATLRAAIAAATPAERDRTGLESRLHAAQMTRVAHELQAVMKGSEEATQKILAAAEDIDQVANNLSAALKGEFEQGHAQDIQERVIAIFEACNFQDLIGQRVAKVMATLNQFESKIARAIANIGQSDAAPPMHGPRLESDRGHVSQNEIDLMFGRDARSA